MRAINWLTQQQARLSLTIEQLEGLSEDERAEMLKDSGRLHAAVRKKDLTLIEYLLNNGVDVHEVRLLLVSCLLNRVPFQRGGVLLLC